MLSIAPISTTDITEIASAFLSLGWNKPESQFWSYLEQHRSGERVVLVARLTGKFCGYVTLLQGSHHSEFSTHILPEIADFNVLPDYRNRGIGSALLDAIEQQALQFADQVGIAVGMTVDYGAAQRMYVKRGYIPTGAGLFSGGKPVAYGTQVTVDDDLLLTFTKRLVDDPATSDIHQKR